MPTRPAPTPTTMATATIRRSQGTSRPTPAALTATPSAPAGAMAEKKFCHRTILAAVPGPSHLPRLQGGPTRGHYAVCMDFPSPASRILGCLAGTAAAEAAAIAGFGPEDPDRSAEERAPWALGPAGQLTLFTADALLEAIEWANDGVHADEAACVWLASLRWAASQGIPLSPAAPVGQPRWLDAQEGVLVPAAVRPAWLGSLAGGEMGSPSRPAGPTFDDAGAAAHAAPFGLVPHIPAAAVVKMSADGASLTHGTPGALQTAVAVASMTHFLVLGADCATAAGSARAQIASLPSPAARVVDALDAGAADVPGGEQDAAATLAGALAAVLAAESAAESGDSPQAAFAAAIELAAAHGPDAAAIAGALLGTCWGADAVPVRWASRTAGMAAVHGLASRLAEATGA